MTEVSASSTASGWAERLSSPHRLLATVFAGLLLIFTLGALAGFTKAFLEHDEHKPIAYVILAALAGLMLALSWLNYRLLASWRLSQRSAFEQRYARMWLGIIALGIPAGFVVGMAGDLGSGNVGSIFGTGPLHPSAALIGAGLLATLFIVAAIYYHRTIDDHEERAYLWASTIAFYFVATVLPVLWLLARGGFLPGIGLGTAMLVLLASFIVQTAVWSWFKFR